MLRILAFALTLFLSALSVAAKRIHPSGDTNWCIHAENVVPRSGTKLGVERCTGSFRQEWNYYGSSSILQLQGTSLCAAPGSSKSMPADKADDEEQNGSQVVLRRCPTNQALWGEVTWHPAGMRQFSWANTNFCLDNADGRLGIHNKVQIWDCHPHGQNQQWTFSGENKL